MINMARNIKSKTAKNGKNANRSLLNPDLDNQTYVCILECKPATQVPNASRSLLNPDFEANL